MIGHVQPGVVTTDAEALRAPAGRTHWAGSEQATEMHGLMEGAVQSGVLAGAQLLAEL